MAAVSSSVVEQYDRMWAMFDATVARFTDEQWQSGPTDRAAPVRWAYHAVVTVDFYAQPSPDGFSWDTKPDWEGPLEALPSRAALLEYTGEVAATMRARILSTTEEQFMEPSAFPWTGESKLGHFLYVLRHTMVHLGELAMLLRINGADEAEWR